MSNKIKKQTSENIRKFILKPEQFEFMVNIDRTQKSTSYYHDQLKLQYLRDIAIEKGYNPSDELELTIDLASKTRELSVKKIN